MKPKIVILITATSFVAGTSSPAAVSIYAEYHLGETGSLGANKRPINSSGDPGRNFTSDTTGGSATVFTGDVFAPGSTAYLSTAGSAGEGWYGADLAGLGVAPNDFAYGVYARSFANTLGGNNSTTTQGNVFLLGSAGISLTSNGWEAPALGASGAFTANEWVHLAVIRSAGISTFYINSVPQAGTSSIAPLVGGVHLSVNPGGGTNFDGDLDEARVVTFTSGESTTNILNALQAVPEPGSALLSGLGGLGLLLRRRRHQPTA